MLGNPVNIDIFLSLGVASMLYVLGFMYALTSNNPGRSFALKIFTWAFIIRIAFAFALYYVLIYLGSDGYVIKDDRGYNEDAIRFARALASGRDGYKDFGGGYSNIAYFNFGTFLYHNFAFDTMGMRMFNGFFGAVSVLFVYYIMMELFDYRTAKIAAMIMAFLPNLVFWSSAQVKDPMIIFCMLGVVYLLICRFKRGLNPLSIFLYLVLMTVLFFLRKSFCVPFIGVTIMWAIFRYTAFGYYFNNPKRTTLLKIILMSILSIPLLVGMRATSSGDDLAYTVTKFNEVQTEISESAPGFSRFLRVLGPGDIYKMPAAMAFTAVAPLPKMGEVKRPTAWGAAIYSYMNLPLVLLMPFMIIGLIKFKSPNMKFTDDIMVRWLPILTWASISIIYMGVLRYKAVLLAYFAMWIAVGIRNRHRYQGLIIFVYAGTILGLPLVVQLARIFR